MIMEREQRISDELKSINKVLDTFSLEDVSAAIFLDVRKSKDNGDYPVKIRVTHKRKQHYYRCMDISIDEWETLISGKKPRGVLLETKKLIYISFQTIIEIIKDLAPGKHFTIPELDMRLSKGTEDSILDAFKNKMEGLEKDGKVGTAAWYKCALKSIEKYTKKDLKFADITPEWLKGYQKHMEEEENKYTTISINMRALRAIINEGKARGIITERQYPFRIARNGKYQIPVASGRKIALNTSQLMKVFKYKILPENEKWRDLFVFSFYCNGANINDILRFKYSNINGNYIEWYREKTKSQDKKKIKIQAKISPEMKKIIAKYGTPDHKPGSYIFPYLSNGLSPAQERMVIQNTIHTINKKMTVIGKALGVGNITTYWARHSYASILRHEGVSVFGISKGMGHKNLTTTEIYLDSLADEEVNKIAAKLPRRQK